MVQKFVETAGTFSRLGAYGEIRNFTSCVSREDARYVHWFFWGNGTDFLNNWIDVFSAEVCEMQGLGPFAWCRISVAVVLFGGALAVRWIHWIKIYRRTSERLHLVRICVSVNRSWIDGRLMVLSNAKNCTLSQLETVEQFKKHFNSSDTVRQIDNSGLTMLSTEFISEKVFLCSLKNFLRRKPSSADGRNLEYVNM